ncbi:PREDICTED: uncharacterized protein LOC109174856 [Ipomoea nil]|uniref:uncharacterized protein LOC109174856 n=1 Tax=Ipomoea nil TaxID=35883 RepID=UPI000900B02F|nr:PREDICTED: uncharacterized protein LOC109174856 [Ipomoea nil]
MAEKMERQIAMSNLSAGNLNVSHANAAQVDQNNSLSDDLLAASINSYNGRKGGNVKAKCTFCSMTGHTIDKCYKKHCYPRWWIPGFKSKGKQQGSSALTGDLGISSEQLQKIISILQPQNNASLSPGTSAAVSLIPSFKEMRSDDKGKYHTNLINSLSICQSSWILDSGATNHIVCSMDFFVDHYKATGVNVNLPTGQIIEVEHIGNVRLMENLWLKEALYIPTFKFNIISVSKLIQDTNCKLTFVPGLCLIQERHGVLTGIAREDKGLYLQ